MMRHTILALMACIPLLCQGQRLTWDKCRRMARDNYPAIRQYSLVESLRDFTVSNASKAWLPQVKVSASAYGFTDLLNANEQMKQMGMDMKNYLGSAMVTARQTVYDGGLTRATQSVAQSQAEVEKRQLDITMHEVDERVEQLFFGVLTLDEQLRINAVLQQDLGVSHATVESLQRNGLANQGDLDAVSVEMMKAEQQAEALAASREAYIRMLGTFIGQPLTGDAEMEKPAMGPLTESENWGMKRPEMAYYQAQNELLRAQRKQLDARLRPTIGLMGAAVFHNQVTDLTHRGWLVGGVSLSWNIGALYTRKNDRQRLETLRVQNENLRETFLFNNRLQNEECDGNVRSLRTQLAKDAEIVTLRERIRQSNEKKVQLGTQTVNELVRSVNDVNMARQQQSLHELQLLQAICHNRTINE